MKLSPSPPRSPLELQRGRPSYASRFADWCHQGDEILRRAGGRPPLHYYPTQQFASCHVAISIAEGVQQPSPYSPTPSMAASAEMRPMIFSAELAAVREAENPLR